MGYSKKGQVDSGQESEGKKWVIAGIAMRATLKPVNTKARGKDKDSSSVVDEEEEYSTTPTAKEARIPERLPCPPAPRKRRPAKPSSSSASRCLYNREFFIPPDLDSVFKCYAEKAN